MDKHDAIAGVVENWRTQVGALFARYPVPLTEDFFPDICAFLRDGGNRAIDASALERAQSRLQVALPPDFSDFIQRFGGMPAPSLGAAESRFLRPDELARYADVEPVNAAIWSSPHPAGIVVQNGIYGADQRPELFSPEHVHSAIALSTQYGSGVYLLNPKVTSDDGCAMEAWLLDSRLPGAMRFPSFTALLVHQLALSIQMLEGILVDAG